MVKRQRRIRFTFVAYNLYSLKKEKILTRLHIRVPVIVAFVLRRKAPTRNNTITCTHQVRGGRREDRLGLHVFVARYNTKHKQTRIFRTCAQNRQSFPRSFSTFPLSFRVLRNNFFPSFRCLQQFSKIQKRENCSSNPFFENTRERIIHASKFSHTFSFSTNNGKLR